MSFHSQPRATKDIDILIKPDADNAKALYAALAKFGAPMQGLTPESFAEQDIADVSALREAAGKPIDPKQ